MLQDSLYAFVRRDRQIHTCGSKLASRLLLHESLDRILLKISTWKPSVAAISFPLTTAGVEANSHVRGIAADARSLKRTEHFIAVGILLVVVVLMTESIAPGVMDAFCQKPLRCRAPVAIFVLESPTDQAERYERNSDAIFADAVSVAVAV